MILPFPLLRNVARTSFGYCRCERVQAQTWCLADVDTGEYGFLGACTEIFFATGIVGWEVLFVINGACGFYFPDTLTFYV